MDKKEHNKKKLAISVLLEIGQIKLTGFVSH